MRLCYRTVPKPSKVMSIKIGIYIQHTSPDKVMYNLLFSLASECKAKADVVFIIDGSGSIEMYGKGNFKKVLDFVKDLTRSFDVSKDGTHVGIVLYSSKPEVG